MKLHHVGVAVSGIAKHAEQYRRAFGISLTSEIIEDELQKVRVAFAQVGDGVFIEFVEPLGDDSPICNLLKRGGGLYHLCYLVPDIEAAIEQVRRAGGVIVDRKSTRLNSSHGYISYAVFCLKKKNKIVTHIM